MQVAQIVPPDCNLQRTLMDVDGLEPERRHQSLVESSASQSQYLGIKGQQTNVLIKTNSENKESTLTF